MADKQRTITQNKAMHLWFGMLADHLNETGNDMRKVLDPAMEIPWTVENVKEMLYRPAMQALFIKKSTTELTTKQVDEVSKVVELYLGQQGVESPAFPSINSLIKRDDSEYVYTKKW